MTNVDILNDKKTFKEYRCGDYFFNSAMDTIYILSVTTSGYGGMYQLIDVKTGSRYGEPKAKLSDVFQGNYENFKYIKNVTIDIGG